MLNEKRIQDKKIEMNFQFLGCVVCSNRTLILPNLLWSYISFKEWPLYLLSLLSFTFHKLFWTKNHWGMHSYSRIEFDSKNIWPYSVCNWFDIKDQKADWRAVDSTKKRTDEFDLFAVKSKKANKSNSSVRFFGEVSRP